MSEDKRQAARTQGRFSGGKEFRSNHKEKEKTRNQRPSKKEKDDQNFKKTQNQSAAAEGMSLEFQEDSNYPINDTEKKSKPQELKFKGVHELSTTDNGISRLIYEPDFMQAVETEEYMTILEGTTEWHDKNIIIRGEEHPQPRLVAWYGPFPYTYSGATLDAKSMPPVVMGIKERIENFLSLNGLDVKLNSVLLNLYRNEKDSVAWHSDDELTMGISPTIASVSLGAVRRFEMRPKKHVCEQVKDSDGNRKFGSETVFYVNLSPGSLIIMDGCMQEDWQHRVPKEFHDKSPRINLTFRTVYPITRSPGEVSYKRDSYSRLPAVYDSVQIKQEYKFNDDNFPSLSAPESDKKSKKPKKEDTPCDDDPVKPSEDLPEISDENSNLVDPFPHPYVEENNVDYTDHLDSSSVYPASELPSDNTDISETYRDKLIESYAFPSDSRWVDSSVNISQQIEKKSTLNAEAPTFVPQSRTSPSVKEMFEKKNPTYEDIIRAYKGVSGDEDKQYFADTLFDVIHFDQSDYFLPRDRFEIDVYFKLRECGLNKEQLDVIVERLVVMIGNAKKHRQRYDARLHFERTSFRENRPNKPRSYSGRKN